tara:strand:- start:127 stop:633 length:507 start_codon:yes stop_codon:yes gene_type:complete
MEIKKLKESTSLNSFILGILIIIGIWLISILIINFFFENTFNENAAWFGDSFGAINSLFSGLAFAGIIYTILLQRQELQLQRQELKNTREELKRSADSQEKTEKLFKYQGDIMNKTARLNGLNQLIEYYSIALNNTDQKSKNRGLLIDKMKSARKKSESILRDLETEV